MNPVTNELMKKLESFNNVLETVSGKVVDMIPNHVSDEIYNHRLTTCQSCEHFTKERRCNLCGCWMINKCKLPKATCPDIPPKW
jgi:hypothetical protein